MRSIAGTVRGVHPLGSSQLVCARALGVSSAPAVKARSTSARSVIEVRSTAGRSARVRRVGTRCGLPADGIKALFRGGCGMQRVKPPTVSAGAWHRAQQKVTHRGCPGTREHCRVSIMDSETIPASREAAPGPNPHLVRSCAVIFVRCCARARNGSRSCANEDGKGEPRSGGYRGLKRASRWYSIPVSLGPPSPPQGKP